ncbi:MAG: glycosyltransferase [Balneolales bacterium]
MNIIHNYDTWLPVTMSWLYNQVRFLPEEFRSSIVCAHTENLDQFGIQEVYSLEKKGKLAFYHDLIMRKTGRTSRHLLNAAIDTEADLLHSHFGHTAWENMRTAKKAGMRHIVTFYGQDVNYLPIQRPVWKTKRYPDLFDHIDAVLCEGPHMKKCIADLGCPPEKITVHHLGVEVDQIPYKPRNWSSGTPFKVLIAATFREKKGIPFALKALAAIQDKVKLEITIIGDASKEHHSQVEKKKILEAIKENNLADRVTLLGFQPHQRFLQEAYRHHLFISPSVTAASGDTEGGAPVSLIEMAASGMPVISTTHCDIPGVILHGETGLLADERDTDGLTDHLNWMIRNTEEWEKMLVLGREHIVKNFDARRQGIALGEIYASIVSTATVS